MREEVQGFAAGQGRKCVDQWGRFIFPENLEKTIVRLDRKSAGAQRQGKCRGSNLARFGCEYGGLVAQRRHAARIEAELGIVASGFIEQFQRGCIHVDRAVLTL